MSSQTLNISLPRELVKSADRLAKREYRSRSELIKEALRKYLIEEDKMKSETVIDFTKIRNGGVPLDELIERLKKLDGQD